MAKSQDDCNLTSQVLEILSGEDGAMRRALELIFNHAMLLDRERFRVMGPILTKAYR